MVQSVVGAASMLAVQLAAAFSFSEIVDAVTKIQKFEATMASFTGSLSSSRKKLDEVFEISNKLGISFEGAAAPFSRFAAAAQDFSDTEITHVFESFATAASGLQMNMNDVNGTFLALQQIVSKGKLSMEELRLQLAERIPGAMPKAAQAAKMSMEQFEEAVRKGTINTREWLLSFSSIVKEDFLEASMIARKSLAASMRRFANQFLQFKAKLGTSGGAAKSFAEVLNTITEEFLKNEDAIKSVSALLGTFANIVSDVTNSVIVDVSKSTSQISHLTKVVSFLYSTLKNWFEIFFTLGDIIGTATVSGVMKLYFAITNISSAFKSVYDLGSLTFKFWVGEAKAAADLISDKFMSWVHIFGEIFKLIKDSFKSLLDSMMGEFANFIGGIHDKIPDIGMFNQLRYSLDKAASGIRGNMSEDPIAPLVERVKVSSAKILDVKEDLKDQSKKFNEDFLSNATATADKMSEIYKKRIEDGERFNLNQKTINDIFFENLNQASSKFKLDNPFDFSYAINPDDLNMKDPIESMSKNRPKVEELNDSLGITRDILKEIFVSFTDVSTNMADSFGKAGQAIDDMTSSIQSSMDSQAKIYKDLAKFEERHADNTEAIELARQTAAKKSAKIQIGSYGDMTSAAQGFYSEGSEGYEALGAAAKIFRVIEMAMAIESMTSQLAMDQTLGTSKASLAVANQASGGDPYSAWVRMAAMAASMAAIGYSISTSSGPNTGPDYDKIRESNREDQTTGTILGDYDESSNSIINALESLVDIAEIELQYSSQMLIALRSVEQTSAINIKSASSLSVSARDTVNEYLSDLKSESPSSVVVSKSYKADIVDFGIKIQNQSVESILNSTALIDGFVDIVRKITTATRVNAWTSKKNVRLQVDSDDAFMVTLTTSINSIYETLSLASNAIGINSDIFNDQIDNFVIDLDASMKGLKGEDLAEHLNQVFSKLGDEMAEHLFSDFLGFQKVSEGFFETITRVASGVEQATSALNLLGIETIRLEDVINTQGIVAVEIFKQSIEVAYGSGSGLSSIINTLDSDFETLNSTFKQLHYTLDLLTAAGQSDISQTMISGAGGLDILTSSLEIFTSKYFSIEEQLVSTTEVMVREFDRLGVALPDSAAGFRTLVQSIDTTTDAGQSLYGGLISLVEGFGGLTDLREKVIEEQGGLTPDGSSTSASIVDQLSGVTEGFDKIIRESAMDEYEIALYNVNAKFQTFADTILNLGVSLEDTNWHQARSIEISKIEAKEISRLESELAKEQADRQRAIEQAHSEATKTVEASISALSSSLSMLEDARYSMKIGGGVIPIGSTRQEAKLELDNVLRAARSGDLSSINTLDKPLNLLTDSSANLFSTFEDYQRDYWDTYLKIEELEHLTSDQLSIEERSLQMIEVQTTAINNMSEQLASMRQELAAANFAIARNTQNTANQLKRWNGDGMPEERPA